MSTDHLSTGSVPSTRSDAKLVQYDEYIDRQVESTRRLVKLVDLATALVVLAAGVLAFLLTAAVAEHWLVPGGFSIAARTVLFAILAGSAAYFAYRRLWPLCVRAINPVYAAQTIEQSRPSLKNSLINLLLFRERRSEISDAVYQTLEEQAAQRLSRVPVEGAVDRSLLIRFGYVLVAIVAVAALYKVLSPKDPLIAARRVLMPWADIVPASRVSITAIEPGSVTVSRGEFINVSAEVRGIGEDDQVLLRYTTDDGQALDKPLPMKPSSDGLRFEARLPNGAEATERVGVAQDLRYRIEAGDAHSLDYAVTVVEAPSILVERVDYDYPAYTGYVDRNVDRLGDIRAIEGTRVTIHARANDPIGEAQIDFDADGRRDLVMTATGALARASFVLGLREDRQTPQHASYVLRFATNEGRPNRNPVKHSISVEADYAPEVAILLPREKTLDVRLDETVSIEVEARDPDFALAEVRLRGEVAGREVIDEPLLESEHKGRFAARYAFMPKAHNLRSGDVVQYWATANDNRTPKANTATSEKNLIRIVSPDPAQQPPPDRLAQRDPRQRPQPEQQPGDAPQQNGGQEGAGGEKGEAGEQQPGAAGGQGEPGENQQPQNGQQGEQISRNAEPGQGEKATGKQGGGEGVPQNGVGDDPARQSDTSDQQPANDKQTGAGAAGGESSQQESQPGGARPDSDNPSTNGNEPTQVSSEGDNDAEAFERIQRHLEQSGELKRDEPPASENEFSRDAERSAEQGQGDNRQGDGAAKPGEKVTDHGEGSGADTKGDDVPKPDASQGDKDKKDQPNSPSGQQTSTKGPSGAGDEQQTQGAPNSQPEMKPAEKRQQSPSQRGESDGHEPPAGARGKKESDSQGEQGGDRAGGGEEGGGQKAPREGTGSAGQNQSADEGAGESAEQGAGNDSPDAGRDSTAKGPTGQPGGETPGRGSEQRDGEGHQPGGESGVKDDPARGGEQRPRDSERTAQDDPARNGEQPISRDAERSADGKQRANQPGAPTGSGGETGTAGAPPRDDGTVPEGDAANLEYARKQTDLVLEKLAEQLNRKRVDDELLDKLGWTEEELRKFVERWQARKEAAQRNDESGDSARRELDEALRSLGVRRGPMQQARVKEDTLRDLREGYRGPVPLEYQERLRAYNQGVSRARQDGE